MNHCIKKLVLLPALAMTAYSAFGQDTLAGPDDIKLPEVRRYTVEMIIFSYAQNVSAGTEIFVPDAPPLEELLEQEFIFDESIVMESIPEVVEEEIVEESIEDPLLDEDIRYAITMLREQDYQLIDIVERLERLDAYEPLMHFGWIQPTYPDEEPETRPLNSFMTPPDGLVGDLTLYLSRYLHLAINLQLDAATDGDTDAEFALDEDRDFYLSYSDQTVSYPVRYRIDEDRIFKNGDLRYYDHPKFGVVAKVTRVEEEEPQEAVEDGEILGEMLGDTESIETESIDSDVE